MGSKEKEIFSRVLNIIVPTLISVIITVVEEVTKSDLNGDGNVGFEKGDPDGTGN